MKQSKKIRGSNGSQRSCVRFTKEQHERILSDSRLSGESVPTLLKKGYFSKENITLMFSSDDSKRIFSALNRIGNNVNQIARRINSGFREGSNEHLCNISEELAVLKTFAEGTYGSCQNKIC